MKTPSNRVLFPALAFGLVVIGGLRAQGQPADPKAPHATDPAKTDAVTLSPFVVETDKDNGYVATDTLTGGRLSTNLLATPADVTVLTRDFLDDLGAFSLADVYVWLPSTDITEPTTGNPDFGQNYNFRGLGGAVNTVNNIRMDFTAEEYTVERLEQSRGPNSILYGDSVSGGQTNVTTKQAKFRNFETLGFRGDSEGSRRVTIDVNRKLGDKLAVRLNAQALNRRTWQDRYFDDHYGALLSVNYRPFKHTEIRFDGQDNYIHSASSSYVYADENSLWDRVTTVSGPLDVGPKAATGLSRFTTDHLTMSPAWNGVLNWYHFAQTAGTNLTLSDTGDPRNFTNFPVLSRRSFSIAPDDSAQKNHGYFGAVTLTQDLPGDLTLELTATNGVALRDSVYFAYYTGVSTDVNRVRPDGTPNPKFGQIYSEGAYQERLVNQYSQNYRASAAYPLPFFKDLLSQVFSASFQRTKGLFDVTYYVPGRSNNPADPNAKSSANQISFWRYWDDPSAPEVLPSSGTNGYDWVLTQTRDTRSTSLNDSKQFNTVGRYFHDTLTLIAGIRYDAYQSDGRDAATYDNLGRVATTRPSHYDSKARTRSAGGTYFPLEWLGVYGNYAEGYFPVTTGNVWIGSRGSVGATTSIGRSAGLRFRVLNSSLVGSIGYYNSREKDRLLSVSSNAINQIWRDLNLNENTISGNYSDTLQYQGEGYEADLTANIGQRFRLKFNVAFPKAIQNGAYPDTAEYLAAHSAQWEAGAADPNNPNAQRIRSNIDTIRSMLNGAGDGRTLTGTSKYRANVFGNYQFTDGFLRGLRVGGGANVFGKMLIGNQATGLFDYIYAKEYYVVTATLAYQLRIAKHPLTLNVNINNLLDYDEPVYRDTAVYNGSTYRNNFRYIEPRKATFSATIGF